MSTPKTPTVEAAPVNPEIDPASQRDADEVARRQRERQQKKINANKTILTSDLDNINNTAKNKLG